ncbi:MAG: ABC transporter ATP-binding protein [Spirochaetales bacterium]|nr:ABC transporter ATP-binding protein [Spirochaetales bacterium]
MLKTLIKFFKFAKSEAGLFKKGIVFGVLSSIFEALQLPALAVVIKALVEGNVTVQTAWLSFGIMAISTAGVVIFNQRSRMSEIDGSFLMCADTRTSIGERMKYMPMGFFNQNNLGYITSAVTSTMEDMQDIAPRIVEKLLHGIIHIVIITIMLMFFDWRIGLITLGGALLFMLINIVMQARSRKISPNRVKAQENIVGAVLEYIQGMGVVKAFNQAGIAQKKIKEAIADCEKWNFGLEITFIPIMFLQSLCLKLVSVVLIAASIAFYFSGTMELYYCLLMLVAAFMLYGKLDMAGSVSALMRTIDLSIDKVNTVNNYPLMDTDGKAITPKNLDIELKDISFSYESKKIIDDVSLSIPQGTTTALVGPSGGGKTTLCNLIARFWDVDEGEITLGGVNIKNYTLDSLLANISMVFQDVYLFNDTIENNIKFGKPDATHEEVIEAAKKACCHNFITELSDGYDTIVGEAGATISGGEKQRISIARAILKDAPIIMLDEATANVDPENEADLQHAISELTKSKTIIMIAHRLKTVRDANQIIVLENGKIAQQGKHEELFNQSGIYRNFINVREDALGWRI